MNFNPYLVFDVPMSADYALLRATYRRLARENHPDVAPDKMLATERMAQINRAWRILGDETRRAAFDAQWRVQHARPPVPQNPTPRRVVTVQTSTVRPPSRPPSPRAQPARGRAGSARKSAPRNATAPRSMSDKLRAKIGLKPKKRAPLRVETAPMGEEFGSPRALRLMRRVTLATRVWHRDGNARSAIETCRAVLLADGRNVPARELLSEIFAAQGRLEIAVMMLDQAIQITPEDPFLRRKRDYLESQRFPNGQARPIKRPSIWQRLRVRFQKRK